ncbi:MAG: ATP-binding protein, partial [Nitrospirota bacterium]|nr:ATP-binding protein [Nitrospirota bacterium]
LANAAARFGVLTKGATCYALTHQRSEPCEDSKHPCVLKRIKETGRPVTLEHLHYDKEGRVRINEIHGYPIFDGAGNIIQIIEYNLDITQRKEDEDRIKASLREKDILLREIHHRVKNNMQIISSLLSLQAEIAGSEKDFELLRDSQNRIKSMSLIHEKLYRSKDMANIDISDYINDLILYIFQFHKTTAGNVSLKLDLENIWIGIDTAIPCGLIINELVTNSLKHAFPENRKGELGIMLRKTEGDEISLTVSDNGIGIPEGLDISRTRSLGLSLVNTLTKDQLQGKIELDRTGGTRFTIVFKEIRYKSRI